MTKEQVTLVVEQVKHAEAAQLVMEPVTAAVMPIYPAKVVPTYFHPKLNLLPKLMLTTLLDRCGRTFPPSFSPPSGH